MLLRGNGVDIVTLAGTATEAKDPQPLKPA